jgi:hypothetical protein
LKKQSQFVGVQIYTKSYLKGLYDNLPACAVRKNKPKQSQFSHSPLLPATGQGKLIGIE